MKKQQENKKLTLEDCIMNENDTKLIKNIGQRVSVTVCSISSNGNGYICHLKAKRFDECNFNCF